MPGPTTPHQPHFTAQQLEQARQRAAQHSAPHQEVLRARLTLVLSEQPHLTHKQAGLLCGLKPHTVYKWRRRWSSEGWSLVDAPRPGRIRSLSPSGPGGPEGSGL